MTSATRGLGLMQHIVYFINLFNDFMYDVSCTVYAWICCGLCFIKEQEEFLGQNDIIIPGNEVKSKCWLFFASKRNKGIHVLWQHSPVPIIQQRPKTKQSQIPRLLRNHDRGSSSDSMGFSTFWWTAFIEWKQDDDGNAAHAIHEQDATRPPLDFVPACLPFLLIEYYNWFG